MSKMMHAIRLVKKKTVLALARIRPGDEWPLRPAAAVSKEATETFYNFSAAHVYSERAVTVPSHRLSRLSC